MASSLQAQKESHVDLLQSAIRWEGVRAQWFARTNDWQQVEDCLARERHLEITLDQAQRDAALMAENRPG